MRTLKVALIVVVLSSMLFMGSPGKAAAVNNIQMPPAITFQLDRNNAGLVNHDFNYDIGIWNKQNTDVDTGFYVKPE